MNKIHLFDNETQRSEVLKLWVLKEASLKLKKLKISNDLRNIEINKSNHIAWNRNTNKFNYLSHITFNEWDIGIASNNPIDKYKTIIWINKRELFFLSFDSSRT